MGIDVYIENQVHDRSDKPVALLSTELQNVAVKGSLLFSIYQHGDTMFNSPQLGQLIEELNGIRTENPELAAEVGELQAIAGIAIRKRGYLWFSGD